MGHRLQAKEGLVQVTPGSRGNVGAVVLWGFFQALPGCGKRMVVVLSFSLIQKILVELLPASDTVRRSSMPKKDIEEGTAASPQLHQCTELSPWARHHPLHVQWSKSMNLHSSPGRWVLLFSCDRFGTRTKRSGLWLEL